ncbi:MAG TPA: translation initiation factor IF-2 [Candidatus Kapabacteria bacterium]|nr:translation initiation factor IF-2 [Candidatus Kapabacteria bacterium]
MPATSTASKSAYKLFKVAAELNIGKETIVEFLTSKGFSVQAKPTTSLSQEMYDLVMDKFEKEHRQIEKQRKKVDAYHERRTKTKDEAEGGEVPEVGAPKRARKASDEGEAEAAPATVETPAEAVAETAAEPQSDPATEPSIERAPVKGAEKHEAAGAIETVEQMGTADEHADRQEAEIAVAARVADEFVEHTPAAEPAAEIPVVETPKAEVIAPTVEPTPVVEEAPAARIETPAETPADAAPAATPAEAPRAGTAKPAASRARTAAEAPAQAEPAVTPTAETVAPEAARPETAAPTEAVAATAAPEPAMPEAAMPEASAPEAAAPEAAMPELTLPEGVSPDDPNLPKEYRAIAPKLQGLTVLGKIELARPADKESKDKRPRKRIRETAKSVDITKEAGSRPTLGTSAGAGTARPAGPGAGQGRPGTGTGTGAGANKKRGKGGGFIPVNQADVSRAITQTFSHMGGSGGKSQRQSRSRDRRQERQERDARRMEEMEREALVLQVTEFVTVAELANLMNVDVGQVIGKCIGLGLMVSINQRLDKDTIQLVADEFGFSIEFQEEYTDDALVDKEDDPETLVPRAPIVTIMGHVDHGKTSLLDYIRRSNVVAGESGGITQHIGAYSVQLPDNRKITFLDTPGHEAFTAMRARGAQVTDIVILVVAADDSVMPQTVEAISHAQAANVPMVVAINKVDKPEANVERIKQQLSDRGVLVEEWGGRYQAVEISAKKGINIDKLLETVLLEAEILDLKASPEREARGVVIEAEIDRGKGIVSTVLIQKGTLRVGDNFVAGIFSGRVRALLDERGNRIDQVGPSEPAQVLGFSGVPTAGDMIICVESEQEAREIATRRQQLAREQTFKQQRHLTLEEISSQIARGGVQHLPLIIKGDVDGSVEALADSLLRLSTPEVQVGVVLKSVGEITESDVVLAAASQAIIIGFHVRPNLKARKLAEREGVEIRTYQIIYDTVNDVRAALEGMLRPEQKEEITGTVEVRETFKVSKIGIIAGCYVVDGRITRNDKVRLLRDGFEVWNGGIQSLRRVKEDVREVEQGFECGVTLDGMSDIKIGDIIEAYRTVEIKRKLVDAATY